METETKRQTASQGELVKVNLLECPRCHQVYVPPLQATKAGGVEAGWYENLGVASRLFHSDPLMDPIVRVSPGKRGRKRCPNCR